MAAGKSWALRLAVVFISFVLPVSMLLVVFILAPDSPLVAGPTLPLAFMPPGVMPDFENGPISPLFALAVVVLCLAATGFAAVGIIVQSRRQRPHLASLVAVAAPPALLWLLVVAFPLAHRVIRDWNPGFTRTDLLSYTAILFVWVVAAVVMHIVAAVAQGRSDSGGRLPNKRFEPTP